MDLHELADEIAVAHRQCIGSYQAGLQHAVRAGQLLLEAKTKVVHGGWLGWLHQHCPFPDRRAQEYMQIAKRLPELERANPRRAADLAGLSLREVSRLIRTAAREERQRAEATADASDPETCTVEDLHGLISARRQFGCIMADPPWQYANVRTRGAAANHYPTMALAEIAALPVAGLAAADAHLHLWATNAFLREAIDLIGAWGFAFRSVFVWAKPKAGLGNYWRVAHEFLLLGVRGRCPFRDRSERSWRELQRGRHSAKPEAVRKLVEKVSPGPRLELFARQVAEGWTSWGDAIERGQFDARAEALAC